MHPVLAHPAAITEERSLWGVRARRAICARCAAIVFRIFSNVAVDARLRLWFRGVFSLGAINAAGYVAALL